MLPKLPAPSALAYILVISVNSAKLCLNRAFSRDVMSAILVYLNNEKSTILVYQISPVGVELFCNAKLSFVSLSKYGRLSRSENALL